MLLSYRCSSCPKMCHLQFYNPCTFLLHTRQHYGPQSGNIDLFYLRVSTLSWDLIGFNLHPDTSRIYDVEEDFVVNEDINTKFYNPLAHSAGQRHVMMSPIVLMFYHKKTVEKASLPPLVLKQLCRNLPLCKFVTFRGNSNPQLQIIRSVEDTSSSAGNYSANDVFNSNTTITTATTTTVTTNLNKIINIPTTKNVLLINNYNANGVSNSNTTITTATATTVTTNLNKIINIPTTKNVLLINSCKQNSTVTNVVNKNTAYAIVPTNVNKTINTPSIKNILPKNKQNFVLINGVNYVQLKDGITVTQSLNINGNSAKTDLTADGEPNVSTLPGPSISCPECNEIQSSTMKIHFVGKDCVPRDRTWQCAECLYIASSKCSLAAHERIHKGDAPHVCPECGKTFPEYLELLNHLDDVCFHLAKQVRFRCPKKNCCKIFAHKGTFFEHFRTHVQVQHICKVCYKSFFTLKDFNEHSIGVHEINPDPSIIFKCTVCRSDKAVIKSSNTLSHVEWHCSDIRLCVYVYVCKYCRNYCRSVTSYAFHIIRCMKKYNNEWWKIKKSNTCTICPNTNCNYIIRMITSMERCPKCGEFFKMKRNHELQPDSVVEVCLGTESAPEKTRTCILCNEKLENVPNKDHRCEYAHPIVVLGKCK